MDKSGRYYTHDHRSPKLCRYCECERKWDYTIQSIINVPITRKTLVLCVKKHVCALSDAELYNGCPICKLVDPTIHAGVGYVSRANNLLRKTCDVCDQVYFMNYARLERIPCNLGHALLTDADSVRVNVIAALEAVIGQVCDDYLFHAYTDFHACAMSYKIVAYIGTVEEYMNVMKKWIDEPSSSEYSLEAIVDPMRPNKVPFKWLCVRVDPSISHDFEACVARFLAATEIHIWLINHRNPDLEKIMVNYRAGGPKLSKSTERPEFPKPALSLSHRPK